MPANKRYPNETPAAFKRRMKGKTMAKPTRRAAKPMKPKKKPTRRKGMY